MKETKILYGKKYEEVKKPKIIFENGRRYITLNIDSRCVKDLIFCNGILYKEV